MFQKENKARQIFWKTNISYPLVHTRMCSYQGVRNVRFSENFGVLCFFGTLVMLGINFNFFLSGFTLTDIDNSQDSRGREWTIFYSTLPLPPVHEHSGIYFQLYIWGDYHVFLISSIVFTRLQFDKIYHLIELPFHWLMMQFWFMFAYLMIWL